MRILTKFLLSAVALVVAAGASLAQRVYVPIGPEAVKAYQLGEFNNVRCALATADQYGNIAQLINTVKVDPYSVSTMGDLVTLSRSLAEKVMNNPFGERGLASIEAGKKYFFWLYASRDWWIGDMWAGGIPSRGSVIEYRFGEFNFGKGANGEWFYPPEALYVPDETEIYCGAVRPFNTWPPNCWVGINASDVHWVESVLWYRGESDSQVTRNGIASTCWASKPLAEGGSYGNGYVYFWGPELSGKQLQSDITDWVGDGEIYQKVILWYDEARTVGDEWDIGSGAWRPIGYQAGKIAITGSGGLAITYYGLTPGQGYQLVTMSSVVGLSSTGVSIGVTDADTNGVASWQVLFSREVPAQFFAVRPVQTGAN